LKVLAAIPARNEKKAISSVVLMAKEHVDTVLVVDDGSTDKTALLAKLAGAEVVSHKVNLGKGSAILTALKWASRRDYDVIIFLDGDGQHDPCVIPDLLEPILYDDVDITIGSRWYHDEGLSKMPFQRVLGNWILSTTTSLSLSKVIKDSQSGYRAFHMRTLPSFIHAMESGFAVESEMITLADKAGFRWKEVGMSATYQNLDTSTESSWYHGIKVLGRALHLLRLNKPVRFFGSMSIMFFLLAIGVSIWGRMYYPDEKLLPLGALYVVSSFTIIASFFMFSGIMMAGLNRISDRIFNVIGEMMKRIR